VSVVSLIEDTRKAVADERYAELANSVDEHCPVLDLFKNPVPVTRVIDAATTAAASA
jgi:hypothetical protein